MALAWLVAGEARADEPRAVLLIYADPRLLPAVVTMDQTVRGTIESGLGSPVRFYTEYLDLSWFPEEHERHVGQAMQQKYAGRTFDLVVPCGESALRFALRQRDLLFPGVPMVFCTVEDARLGELPLPADVTGVTMLRDWAAGLDLVLRLHPRTHRITFVSGSGEVERGWERTFSSPEALALIGAAAGLPIYGFAETQIGHGIVGGLLVSYENQARGAGELAVRILRGERLGPADIVRRLPGAYVFDGRQLRRWRIDEERLPPGSVVRFADVGFWQRYKWQALGAAALVLVQTLLVVGLLAERRRTRRARDRLDERLRFEILLADLGGAFIEVPARQIDDCLHRGLGRVLDELGLDRVALAEFVAGGAELRLTHVHAREGLPPAPGMYTRTAWPWTMEQLYGGHPVSFSTVADLPAAAAVDRRSFVEASTKSVAILPIVVTGTVVGVLGCAMLRHERRWPAQVVQRMRLLADLFAVLLMRRRADEAVKESESRFHLMADAAPVMVWVAGPDGGCLDFNRAWLEFTGRRLADEVGDGWLQGVHPDDREACLGQYRTALAARRPFTMEYRLRRADGVYRVVLDNGVPRFNSGHLFQGYIGSATDISEVKAAQQSMVESIALREDLAHALRVATVGELTASIAHEINQPLTAIATNAQAARNSLAGADVDAEITEMLRDITADAHRAAQIIRRLRALFRKAPAERRPIDVGEVVKDVLGLVHEDVERRRIQLDVSLQPDAPRVMADVVQLQQVMLNVLMNAAEALMDVPEPRHLTIDLGVREAGVLAITVCDSGTGVSAEELERIFDRFVSRKREGLGMGLAISRSIMEAHGGRIWATRNADRGLTLHLELPC